MSTWIRIAIPAALIGSIALAASVTLARPTAPIIPDILALSPVQEQPQRRDEFTYYGFRFKTAAIAGSANEQALVASAKAQVELVEHVGLSADTIAYLRTFPIHLSEGPGGGHFGHEGVSINLPPRSDDRPILLHEEMHAFQFGRLPGGYRNPELLGFYQQARTSGALPGNAYMLTKPAEFFAMTASVELHGTAARPPFNRSALEEKMPDYAAWLRRNVR